MAPRHLIRTDSEALSAFVKQYPSPRALSRTLSQRQRRWGNLLPAAIQALPWQQDNPSLGTMGDQVRTGRWDVIQVHRALQHLHTALTLSDEGADDA